MINLSVTIISKNEAQNIEECLHSVAWASEIVLVDQFSEDGTAEIANQFGAKVFKEPWRGFSSQKNFAISKASGPWILSLDADERVTPVLRKEIEEKLTQETDYDGYYIARKNFFCGQWIRHGGWYPDYTLKLFRKSKGRFQDRAVHEKVVIDGKVGYLEHPLEHFTYRSVSDFLVRLDTYSRLAAQELRAKSKWSISYTLCLRPFFTFINMYLLRRGVLDGAAGLFLAISYSYYTFLKYYRSYKDHHDYQFGPKTFP
jgi:glycosyltransferase involved in cell wall biosynthesis